MGQDSVLLRTVGRAPNLLDEPIDAIRCAVPEDRMIAGASTRSWLLALSPCRSVVLEGTGPRPKWKSDGRARGSLNHFNGAPTFQRFGASHCIHWKTLGVFRCRFQLYAFRGQKRETNKAKGAERELVRHRWSLNAAGMRAGLAYFGSARRRACAPRPRRSRSISESHGRLNQHPPRNY
jgi:hypothetical protein